jgi:hypothetical protein
MYETLSVTRTLNRSTEQNQLLKEQHPAELKAIHVRNLRIVLDRNEFLRAMPQRMDCAEVGVAHGEFSRQILDVMQPTSLCLIDLWSADSERYSEAMAPALNRVQPEIDSGIVSVRRGWSWEEIEQLADESLDWVYLDAAHDFDSVSKDLAAVRTKMRPGGLICGHDYTRWSSAGIHRWGVVEAVNEFCVRYHWEFLYLTHETHRHLSYALRKIVD